MKCYFILLIVLLFFSCERKTIKKLRKYELIPIELKKEPKSFTKDYFVQYLNDESGYEIFNFRNNKKFKAQLLVSTLDRYIVFKDKNGFFGILDSSLKEITKTRYESIENIYTNNMDETPLFTDGFCRVIKDSKQGFINKRGEIVFPTIHEIGGIDYIGKRMFRLRQNDFLGVVGLNKELIVPFKYIGISECKKGKFIALDIENRIVLINKTGDVLKTKKSDKYVKIIRTINNFCLIENSKGKVGLFDFDLNQLSQFVYSEYDFSEADENNVWIRKNKRFALFDNKGRQLTSFLYEEVNPIIHNSAIVRLKSKNGYFYYALISEKGKQITKHHYGSMYELGRNKSIVVQKSEWVRVRNSWGVRGNLIILKRNGVEIEDGVEGISLSFSDNLISCSKGSRKNLILDDQANLVVDEEFERIYCLHKDGAIIQKKNKLYALVFI